MALVPEASCPQLKNGNYLCFEFVSFKERSDLVFVWPTVFGGARKAWLKKEDLSGFTNCLPSYPSFPAHANGHTIEQPARNGHERKRAHKNNSALVNGSMAFKAGKDKQLKIQPSNVLSKQQTAHWGPLELCFDAKFNYTLKY